MSKAISVKRLVAEDFKDQVDWIEPLLLTVNSFMDQTVASLNKSLTVGENMAGAMKLLEVTGVFPVRLAWDRKDRPKTVIVGNVYRADGSGYTLSQPVTVQWGFNQQGQLQIDAVAGLLPRARHTLSSADVTANTLTIPGHEFYTGLQVTLSTTGAAPTGLTAGSTYFVISTGPHTLKLATTYDNAVAGTAVSITAATGTGYQVLTPGFYKKFILVLECKVA